MMLKKFNARYLCSEVYNIDGHLTDTSVSF